MPKTIQIVYYFRPLRHCLFPGVIKEKGGTSGWNSCLDLCI